MKSKAIMVGFLILIVSVFCCNVHDDDYSILKGPYLGQNPPGMTPEIFAPGIITTYYHEHSSPAFSPDGKEVFWSVFFNFYGPQVIVWMNFENGLWKVPEVAPFSGQYTDGNPVFTRDGKKLYFESHRPVQKDGEYTGNIDLWVVKRNEKGWEEPEHLGWTINSTKWERGPSISDNGNLYFASWREGGFGASDIYRSRFVNGRFLEPENLGSTINTKGYENWPFIAPDESYLLFESDEGSICISFRRKDSTWSEPISMAKELGTFQSQDRFPKLSFDGRYLFFVSSRRIGKRFFERRLNLSEVKRRALTVGNGFGDVYWVDAKIIEELKPKELR